MALLIDSRREPKAAVIEAAVASYAARGDRVRVMPLSDLVADSVSADLSTVSAIIAAEQRAVEIVADDGLELERLAPATWAMAGRGWDVVVLVPSERIGDAHASLRSVPCHLQPWWIDPAGLWFGALEIP